MNKKKYCKSSDADFMYAVAHDISSPLRHITSFLDILFEDMEDNLDEDQRQYKSIIYDATNHAQEKLNALLQLSQIKPLNSEPTSFDINECIEQEIAKLQSSCSRNFRTHIEINTNVGKLSTYPDIFRMLLLEIIKNSAQHAMTNNELELTFQLDSLGGKTYVNLFDNGEHVDFQNLDLINRPFYTTKKDDGFLGMGGCRIERAADILNADWAKKITDKGGLQHSFII